MTFLCVALHFIFVHTIFSFTLLLLPHLLPLPGNEMPLQKTDWKFSDFCKFYRSSTEREKKKLHSTARQIKCWHSFSGCEWYGTIDGNVVSLMFYTHISIHDGSHIYRLLLRASHKQLGGRFQISCFTFLFATQYIIRHGRWNAMK